MNDVDLSRYVVPLTAALVLTGGCRARVPYCEEEATVIDSLDAPTPAGVTAGEILAVVDGQRSAELTYTDQSDVFGARVEISPGGHGSTELSLRLSRAQGGGLRWIDTEKAIPPGFGSIAEPGLNCLDRIEIDAQLEFVTTDGVFAEQFDVVVEADIDDWGPSAGSPSVARIRRIFDPGKLIGALEVVSIDPPNPDSIIHALEIHYPLTEHAVEDGGEIGQPSGSVHGGTQHRTSLGVEFRHFQIASFGDWNLW